MPFPDDPRGYLCNWRVYQCYAPNELRTGKTSRKIREDFAGAEQKWGAKMKQWAFVWNTDALPPHVVAVLAELATECKGWVTIEQFGTEKLWNEVVSKLSKSNLDELLGEVPTSTDLLVSVTTAFGSKSVEAA